MSPDLNPIENLWRELKSACAKKTHANLKEASNWLHEVFTDCHCWHSSATIYQWRAPIIVLMEHFVFVLLNYYSRFFFLFCNLGHFIKLFLLHKIGTVVFISKHILNRTWNSRLPVIRTRTLCISGYTATLTIHKDEWLNKSNSALTISLTWVQRVETHKASHVQFRKPYILLKGLHKALLLCELKVT